MEMGCYGIGVTRIVAAAIEQSHDERGIVCPMADRPLRGRLVPIGAATQRREAADDALRGAAPPRASTCSSTTATSAPACCSPTWSLSASRTGW